MKKFKLLLSVGLVASVAPLSVVSCGNINGDLTLPSKYNYFKDRLLEEFRTKEKFHRNETEFLETVIKKVENTNVSGILVSTNQEITPAANTWLVIPKLITPTAADEYDVAVELGVFMCISDTWFNFIDYYGTDKIILQGKYIRFNEVNLEPEQNDSAIVYDANKRSVEYSGTTPSSTLGLITNYKQDNYASIKYSLQSDVKDSSLWSDTLEIDDRKLLFLSTKSGSTIKLQIVFNPGTGSEKVLKTVKLYWLIQSTSNFSNWYLNELSVTYPANE